MSNIEMLLELDYLNKNCFSIPDFDSLYSLDRQILKEKYISIKNDIVIRRLLNIHKIEYTSLNELYNLEIILYLNDAESKPILTISWRTYNISIKLYSNPNEFEQESNSWYLFSVINSLTKYSKLFYQ